VPYPPHLYDDLAPGLVFESGPRVITRQDIASFSALSGDHTPLHSDDAYAAATPLGAVVAHGALNLAVATGLAFEAGAFRESVLAFVSMTVRFERPVFPGDAVTLRLRVAQRDQRPRPDRGRVTFEAELVNQHGKTVLSGDWTLLMRRAPARTAADRPH
jgi:acyl dehydratase